MHMIDMSVSEVIWFLLLSIMIFGIGSVVVSRLVYQCSMSEADIKNRMSQQDMVEMQEMVNDRAQFDGEILYSGGC